MPHEARTCRGLRAAVIVTGDRVYRGEVVDEATPLLEHTLREAGHELVYRGIAPNDANRIRLEVLKAVIEANADLVVVVGGTGPRPRDVSVEAVEAVADKELPGFGEEFRRRSLAETPHALLSRATAFIVSGALVLVTPGSPSAAKLMLEVALPAACHAIEEARRRAYP